MLYVCQASKDCPERTTCQHAKLHSVPIAGEEDCTQNGEYPCNEDFMEEVYCIPFVTTTPTDW